MDVTYLVLSCGVVVLLALILSTLKDDKDESKEALKKAIQKKLDQAIIETKEIGSKLNEIGGKKSKK